MCGIGFLDTLHEDLLKTVFRRRAFETHPDRAGCAGLDPVVMTQRFQEVHAAKELLNQYLAERGAMPVIEQPASRPTTSAPPPRPRPSQHAGARAGAKTSDSGAKQSHRQAHTRTPPKSRAPQPSDFFWAGRLPERSLPLGEYLYYCGRISLQTLIAAIHAQRVQRPLFGQVAVHWGYLRPSSLSVLVSRKKAGERIGDAALRLGVLTPYQRDVIVGMQRTKQSPFGRYFTDSGLLSDAELGAVVRDQRLHNFRRTSRRAS